MYSVAFTLPAFQTRPSARSTGTAVARAVDAGDAAAPDRFWSQLPERRSPLIERIPGDAAHVRATFLWRGGDDTKDVGGDSIGGLTAAFVALRRPDVFRHVIAQR